MNKSVYIFGKQASGHTQWPDDSSSEILSTFYGRCKVPTQIIVHRDGAMIYYSYIRQLDDEKCIGLCVAVNGFYISSIDSMFTIYEKAIENMAEKGVFLRFTYEGELISGTASFASEEEEVDTLTHRIGLEFDALDDGLPSQLPPMDYTNAKDSVKIFSISDDMRDIVRATYTYGYTIIYKEKDFNTVRMNSYSGQLERLNQEIEKLKKSKTQNFEFDSSFELNETGVILVCLAVGIFVCLCLCISMMNAV